VSGAGVHDGLIGPARVALTMHACSLLA
jgi:hypothetical protein